MPPEPGQTINVPLPQFVEQIADRSADRAARAVIKEHLELCETRKELPRVSGRVKVVELGLQRWQLRLVAILFFMLGSGTLGGLLGGLLVRIFHL
jgi:hypothetical protein